MTLQFGLHILTVLPLTIEDSENISPPFFPPLIKYFPYYKTSEKIAMLVKLYDYSIP